MTLRISKISRYSSSYDVVGYLLRLMSSIWHRQLNSELASIDLTEMQFVLLMGLTWILEEQPEGVTQTELADACGCSKALASQVMQNLVRKSLVEITDHAKDARARIVRLSKAGESKVRAAVQILERTDAEFRSDNPAAAQRLFDALAEFIEIKLSRTSQPVQDLGAMPRHAVAAGSRARRSPAVRNPRAAPNGGRVQAVQPSKRGRGRPRIR